MMIKSVKKVFIQHALALANILVFCRKKQGRTKGI